MKLSQHPLLDLIIGEYVIGTLRGGARRRFERLMSQEQWLNARVSALTQQFSPNFSNLKPVQPSSAVWKNIQSSLNIQAPPSQTWWQKLMCNVQFEPKTVGLSVAFSVVLALSVSIYFIGVLQTPPTGLTAQIEQSQIHLDIRTKTGSLVLKGTLGVLAKVDQSYELWLVSPERKTPQSMGLLKQVNLSGEEVNKLQAMLKNGAKLAVSIEPIGGSPSGLPTGPVAVLEIDT
jgi:anti-sigma-K factor RskA